jgi:hypothetical protein
MEKFWGTLGVATERENITVHTAKWLTVQQSTNTVHME